MDYRLACTWRREKMPNVACNISSFFFFNLIARTTQGFLWRSQRRQNMNATVRSIFELLNIWKTERKKKICKEISQKRQTSWTSAECRCWCFGTLRRKKKIITTSCILLGQYKTTTNHNKKRLVLFFHLYEGTVLMIFACVTRCVCKTKKMQAF